jgi:TRAP-type C4-dicarboxylate transport system substrate-binding protein
MDSRQALLIAAAAVSFFAQSVPRAAAEQWDMPLAYAATNFHSENAAQFAECVGRATDGGLEIITHPNGSLFAGNDIKRAVQTGQAPIGERLLSAHANADPMFAFDSVPFLASSFDDAERLWLAAKPTIQNLLDAQNLVFLYSVPWPPQGLYTDRPVASAFDLRRLKFRAYNAATARIAELAGMQPIQLETAEVTQALATGVVQSFIASAAVGVDLKVWEHLDFFYEIAPYVPRNTVFANKDSYEALPVEHRQALQTCAGAAAARGLEMAKDHRGTVQTLVENGMTVQEPSDELVNDLRRYGETMTREWLESAGESGQAVVDAYRAK